MSRSRSVSCRVAASPDLAEETMARKDAAASEADLRNSPSSPAASPLPALFRFVDILARFEVRSTNGGSGSNQHSEDK